MGKVHTTCLKALFVSHKWTALITIRNSIAQLCVNLIGKELFLESPGDVCIVMLVYVYSILVY